MNNNCNLKKKTLGYYKHCNNNEIYIYIHCLNRYFQH